MLIKIIWGAIIVAVIAIILADRWYRAKRRRYDQVTEVPYDYGFIVAEETFRTGKMHVGHQMEDGSFEVREVE